MWRAQCVRDFPFVNVRAEDGSTAWKKAYMRAKRQERGWRAGTVRDWKLTSMRAGDEGVSPVSALLCAGPGDVYSANGSAVHRWVSGRQAWTCALTAACTGIMMGAEGSVWALCSDGLLYISADGRVIATHAVSATCCAAVGATAVWATSTHVRWSTGPQHAQAGVLALVSVANGFLAVDGSGVTLYSQDGTQLVHRQPVAGSVGAVALTHRLVALITHTALVVYDSHTRSLPLTHNVAQLKSAHYDEGRLVLVSGHNQGTAAIHPFVLSEDGSAPGALAAATHVLAEAQPAGANSWALQGRRLVCASRDNAIRVFDVQDGRVLYALLGGSMQARADNPPHPQRPGCSFVQLQPAGVTGAFNAVVKTWQIKDE